MKLVVLLLLSFSAWANYPVSPEKMERIEKHFFKDGAISQKKIEKFKDGLKDLRSEVKDSVQNYVLANTTGISTQEAEEEAKDNKFVKNMNRLRKDWINEIYDISDPVEQVEYLAQILDIYDAMKSEITPSNDTAYFLGTWLELLKVYKIPKKADPTQGEAWNLINPETNKYYSQGELKNLIKSGYDISLLNPPRYNGAVELINDISKVDVHDRYRNGNTQMHQGLEVNFPATNVGFFTAFRKTQTRPKIMFETRDANGKKIREYKIKMGKEVHTEATAAALGTSVGLFHDLSKYVRDIKIFIGDMTYEQWAIDFSSYFKYDDLDRIVKEIGKDPVHGNYIIFKEGLIEMRFKSKDLRRLGPFYPLRQKGKREVRALMAFNLWVHNTGMKIGENNKTLSRDFDDRRQVFYSMHDIGTAFGRLEKEKPTDFMWNVVRKNTNNYVSFYFRSAKPVTDYEHVTYYDAKWMIRKIAQLTREQITTAVKFGGWPSQSPYNYEQLIIEKLISRRNDLVKNFDLLGETLPNGKTIQIMPFTKEIIKDAVNATGPIPGYTVDFRPAIKYDYVVPALKGLRDTIVDGTAAFSRNISKLPADTWLGLDDGIIAKVLIGTDKSIVENPDPKTLSERLIVQEKFRMGARLGYGFGLSADSSYVKEYTLIYPAQEKKHVDKHGKWIVDVTMPYRVMKNYLPKNHILIVDSYIENRGRAKYETPFISPVSMGVDAAVGRIDLSRVVLSKKHDDHIKMFVDNTGSNYLSESFYTKLSLLKLRHWKNENVWGNLNRQIFQLDNSPAAMRTIDEVVMQNNASNLGRFEKIGSIKSDFIEHKRGWSFLGFFSKGRKSRVDDYKMYRVDENENLVEIDHQLEGSYQRSRSWSFLKDGEDRDTKVTMSSEVKENGEIVDPYINIHFVHKDKNTNASEMDKGYIPFFNGVAGDKDFIEFNAKKLSITGKYGELNFHLRQKVYAEGIDKLLNLSKEEYLDTINSMLKIKDIREIKYERVVSPGSKIKRKKLVKEYIKFKGIKYRKDILFKIAKNVFSSIVKAQKENDRKTKIKTLMRVFVDAMPKKGHSQNPVIMAALNRIMGPENYFLTAEIETPSHMENKLPGRIVPFNFQGAKRDLGDRELMKIQLLDAIDIYNMF